MSRIYYSDTAEKEANKIGEKFAKSSNVMQDMARAYHTDFSTINIHTDDAADRKVRAVGKDALASGNDLFFGKGIFESSHPAAKALVGHELAHVMQQNVVSSEGAVQESVPMGAEQGGKLLDWFKNLFARKKNKEEELQFSSAPKSAEGMSIKELWTAGNNGKKMAAYREGLGQENDPLLKAISQRTDLYDVMGKHVQQKGAGFEEFFNNSNLMNASGTVSIAGLGNRRLVGSMIGAGSGQMSKEEIVALFDKLLSGGDIANVSARVNSKKGFIEQSEKYLTRFQKQVEELEKSGDTEQFEKKKEELEKRTLEFNEEKRKYQEDVKLRESYEASGAMQERDKQFDEGFIQLKKIYLGALRRLKTKYGTYITQLHPEDFLQKVGMDFFDDTSILQDTQQMMKSGTKYFDYEHNPEDTEFKLLNDYYGNAKSQIEMYVAADQNRQDMNTFNPDKQKILEAEQYGYLDQLQASEMQLKENDKDIKGFTEKEQTDYNKRLQKRFKKSGIVSRLFGRFRAKK